MWIPAAWADFKSWRVFAVRQNPAAVFTLRAGRVTALAVAVGALADVGFEIRIVRLRIVAHEAAVDTTGGGTADSIHT